MNDTQRFADGFAFYKSGGSPHLVPTPGEDHREWITGFCQAMADYDPWRAEPTIQAALLHRGLCSDLLAELLQAAEAVIAAGEWVCSPAVPVRGWGRRPEAGPGEAAEGRAA